MPQAIPEMLEGRCENCGTNHGPLFRGLAYEGVPLPHPGEIPSLIQAGAMPDTAAYMGSLERFDHRVCQSCGQVTLVLEPAFGGPGLATALTGLITFALSHWVYEISIAWSIAFGLGFAVVLVAWQVPLAIVRRRLKPPPFCKGCGQTQLIRVDPGITTPCTSCAAGRVSWTPETEPEA